jgi:hypothetical protein
MENKILKILFTASDPAGRETALAMFDDGCWAILIGGLRQQASWPYGQLAAAAGAYRRLIFDSRLEQLDGTCSPA